AGVGATADITGMFNNMFPKFSGGMAQGVVNASLEDLDSRMTEVDGSTGRTCLTAIPVAHRIDASAISPALHLTVNIQCVAAFCQVDGGVDGQGSGLAYGKDSAGNYSMWLYLKSNASANGFGYFASVQNAGTNDKAVDFLSLTDALVMEPGGGTPHVSAYR